MSAWGRVAGSLASAGDDVCGEYAPWTADDGPGTRLPGVRAPDVELGLVPSGCSSLAALARSGPLIVVFYGGREDERRAADTLRVLRWCQRSRELAAHGYRLVAVSAQPVQAQAVQVQGILAAQQDETGCLFASDPRLLLARELGLPTVRAPGGLLYERLTLLVREGRVTRVWFPVDPARDAANVCDWIRHTDA